ncbi:MAG: NAD(P)H-hydrate dehydratase [Candidatus Aenigmatarchaeota archaeon]
MENLLEKLDRKSGSHKGQNGRVAVIAGSRDFTGAPALVAKAALRTGCDLVKIMTSEEVEDVVASFSENFIVESYTGSYFGSEDVEDALRLADWADVVVIGPGLSKPGSEAVKQFVNNAGAALVVDADAIGPATEVADENMVFTPHSGEAEPVREEFGSVESFVESTGAKVLLKGGTDTVYSPEDIEKVSVGCAGMTVGGTGDVLAGVVAGLIAQGIELEDASLLGVWINGQAGEKAFEKFGNGLLATDVIEQIPEVMN